MKIYPGKSLNEFQTFLRLEGMSEIQARKISLLRLYFSWYFPARTECNYKTEPFSVIMYQTTSFREKLVCDSFHISHFYVCWAVDIRRCVFSAVVTHPKKTTMADFRYKSIKSWKSIISIWHSNLVYRFSLISVINR